MIRVIDANILVALVLPLPYSQAARDHVQAWQKAGVGMAAPSLIYFETNNALLRSTRSVLIAGDDLRRCVEDLFLLQLQTFSPTETQTYRAIAWATRLQQSRIYDAYYVALAESLEAPFWSADRRLVNGLRDLGVGWAFHVAEADPFTSAT